MPPSRRGGGCRWFSIPFGKGAVKGKREGAANPAAPPKGGGAKGRASPEGPVEQTGHFGPGDGGEGIQPPRAVAQNDTPGGEKGDGLLGVEGHVPGVGESGQVAVGGEEAETFLLLYYFSRRTS